MKWGHCISTAISFR